MALGVQNYFVDPLGFRIVCETVLGVRNVLHGLQKFCRVCKVISQGLAYFQRVCEILHPIQIELCILHAL